eukprot:TRINITY_DN7582_c0_g1_i1.p1 TRINITY_DN7582_c0_g1~~TRINITY_DN7582_c0_g1_i1.p1  ORF type:complete len:481 (-),score=94.25 TRINITY_DN7582_c0_g1_i1:43-1485(-)
MSRIHPLKSLPVLPNQDIKAEERKKVFAEINSFRGDPLKEQEVNSARTPKDILDSLRKGVTKLNFRSKKTNHTGTSSPQPSPHRDDNNNNKKQLVLFGGELTALHKTKGWLVPPLVEKCIARISEVGHVKGIYRVAGTHLKTLQLKEAFEAETNGTGGEVNLSLLDGPLDIHCVADLLKNFLHQLANPLLTFELYSEYLHCVEDPPTGPIMAPSSLNTSTPAISMYSDSTSPLSSSSSSFCNISLLAQLVCRLPSAHYLTGKALFNHLSLLLEDSEQTGMNVCNLARVFAPSLLRGPEGPKTDLKAMDLVKSLRKHQIVLEAMISEPHLIFLDHLRNDLEVPSLPPLPLPLPIIETDSDHLHSTMSPKTSLGDEEFDKMMFSRSTGRTRGRKMKDKIFAKLESEKDDVKEEKKSDLNTLSSNRNKRSKSPTPGVTPTISFFDKAMSPYYSFRSKSAPKNRPKLPQFFGATSQNSHPSEPP